MTGENKRRNIGLEAGRADRALDAARLLHASGFFEDAVTRVYAAAFHYAKALLLIEGLEVRTHAGVRNQLGMNFVVTGRLEPATAAHLTQLQALREQSDYDTGAVFTEGMAAEALSRAERFRAAARQILESEGYL